MHVELSGVVLFLHITVAIVAFAMAGVLHTSLQVIGRARRVQDIRTWGAVAHRIEPLFPFMALLLLALGAWLVHLGHTEEGFSFSTGWILTGVITLVAVEAVGGAILAPRGKKLTGLIEAAPDGEVTDDIRAAARDPLFWDMAHLTTFSFLGIVFVMSAKPDGVWSAVFPIVGAVVGVVLSRWQLAKLPPYDDAPAGGGEVPGQRATGSVTPAR
jgi:hypothetical protein